METMHNGIFITYSEKLKFKGKKVKQWCKSGTERQTANVPSYANPNFKYFLFGDGKEFIVFYTSPFQIGYVLVKYKVSLCSPSISH